MAARSDDYYMARAVALAETAIGRTGPNPAVGCVLVRDDEVVGEGYHPGAGSPHAEIYAIEAAGADARGATAYVTLEPCSTTGRTPPCTDALIHAGVQTVVYGTTDPNPAHRGQGLRVLEAAGVNCRSAGDERLLRSLNRGFFSWMERGRPYLDLKLAVTLDGRVTTTSGRGTQLSGPAAEEWTHRWRAIADAVLVGVDTVITDDPLLTARPLEGVSRQPLRVVLDSRGRLPLDSRVVGTAAQGAPVLVLTTGASPASWREALEAAGVGVEVLPAAADGHVEVGEALRGLGERGLTDVVVECGPTLLGVLLARGVADRLNVILTGWIGGETAAPRWFDGLLGSTQRTDRLALLDVRRLGEDVLLTFDVTDLTQRSGRGAEGSDVDIQEG